MPDGIDATVNRLQSALTHPVIDRARVDTCIDELTPSDHSVLLAAQGRDQPIGANIAFTHVLRG
jgi:hypothetical protein